MAVAFLAKPQTPTATATSLQKTPNLFDKIIDRSPQRKLPCDCTTQNQIPPVFRLRGLIKAT
jgi:hypothetical protein